MYIHNPCKLGTLLILKRKQEQDGSKRLLKEKTDSWWGEEQSPCPKHNQRSGFRKRRNKPNGMIEQLILESGALLIGLGFFGGIRLLLHKLIPRPDRQLLGFPNLS
nr:hypothetical protein Itr_chr04CG21140 [Ipomoea trifida]